MDNARRKSNFGVDHLSFLPCLRHGDKRWWLPCDATVSLLLAELVVDQSEISPTLRKNLLIALEQNPPLFIFCVFNLAMDSDAGDESQLTIHNLLSWLEANLTGCLVEGEAFLGCPKISSEAQTQWSRMRSFFQTLPTQKWAEHAHLWLEITGPKVPKKIRKRCSELIIASLEIDPTLGESGSIGDAQSIRLASHHLLEKLARQIRQKSAISKDFDNQVQRRKTEAIKELAYGLSHEINNPLANISARAQQLEKSESDPKNLASLKRISDQVYRAHEMIADLMFYANPPSKTLEWFDVAILAQEVIDRYQVEASKKSIRIELRNDLPYRGEANASHPTKQVGSFSKSNVPTRNAQADRGMIGEAIGSLIRNAVEAISDSGNIEVSVIEDDFGIRIEVADSGPGLSEQARQNAFDPYFSGREAGRGLGLGLCRVARIAELHGGTAEIAGSVAGCVARITLPRN